uniref:Uncharacterized protein n=1 Tax=Ascaris lumbricoides TaxID=6252 RepID=A0A0M3IJ53_ASCLU
LIVASILFVVIILAAILFACCFLYRKERSRDGSSSYRGPSPSHYATNTGYATPLAGSPSSDTSARISQRMQVIMVKSFGYCFLETLLRGLRAEINALAVWAYAHQYQIIVMSVSKIHILPISKKVFTTDDIDQMKRAPRSTLSWQDAQGKHTQGGRRPSRTTLYY